MKKHLITFLFLFVATVGFSQEIVKKRTTNTINLVGQAEQMPTEGTYQIVIKGNEVPTIPNEIMYQVNHKRAYEEVTYIFVNEYVKIKILPFKAIRAASFEPLKMHRYEN